MTQIEIATVRPPYGVDIEARRQGIRLKIKSIAGWESYINLPDHIAVHLRDQLDAALAASTPDQAAEAGE